MFYKQFINAFFYEHLNIIVEIMNITLMSVQTQNFFHLLTLII